jgi:membrane-associated protease RseP (regulator of RpoE activity)
VSTTDSDLRNGGGATAVDHTVTVLEAPPAAAAPPAASEPIPTPSTGWALLRLAVVVAAIVAIFVALGASALLIVIAVIIVMVMLHELGHFATAKWSKMLVTQYFVGFGPTLWSIRRGETEYGIKAIPAGGFVKIPGMTNLEDIDPSLEARTYRQQPFGNRILVACAGSFMHLVLALVLAWVAVVAFGVPSANKVAITGFTTWAGHAETAAQAAGLRPGDVVVGVNGHPLTNGNEFGSTIQRSADKPVQLTVERAGETVQLTVTPALGHYVGTKGETLGKGPGKATGMIGVSLGTAFSAEGPIRAVGTAVNNLGHYTAAEVAGLGQIFSPHGLSNLFSQVTNPQVASKDAANPATSDRPSSIVGITRATTQADQAGVYYLLLMLIVINLAFAILNMLPMLPLDGGHVAIAVYERIRTRRGQRYYQADAAKLMPVVYLFVSLLVVLVLASVFLDIAHPVANQFP